MESFITELDKLTRKLLIPRIYQMREEEGIEIYREKLSNYLGAPISTHTIVSKCLYISNKGKNCGRRAVQGKHHCTNHIDKDKKKNTRKNSKKMIGKTYIKEEEIQDIDDEITVKYFDIDNKRIFIMEECGFILYKITESDEDYVVIGKYEYDGIEELDLLKKLEKCK